MKRVVIAGGGTGGHIAPALAVGRLLHRERWAGVFYVRTDRPVDRVMYQSEGDRVHLLRSPRIDRAKAVFLPFTGTAALIRAMILLRRLKADAVLGTGGYASFYAVIAARLLGLPGAVLETNAVPGRSNRLASRFCRLAFTAFSSQESLFHCPVVAAGIPRETRTASPGARERLGLSSEVPVVLVLGGSQGARALNDLALSCPERFHLLLQCGEKDEERVRQALKTRNRVHVAGFLQDLSDWYASAWVAVARAGAQTLAELSLFSVPTVFIPYPHAADDHQTANARVAEHAGGAWRIRQEELDPKAFWERMTALLEDGERLRAMSEAMGNLLPGDAAERVAREMVRLCG